MIDSRLHAAVVGVLPAVEQTAAGELVDGAAGAGERQAEALGERLDGRLAVGRGGQGLELREAQVEPLELADQAAARAHGMPVERREAVGERRCAVGLHARCVHARKYCMRVRKFRRAAT